MKLIVALNNPGKEYEQTRHNAGKWVLDELCRRHFVTLKEDKKFFGLVGEVTLNNQKVRLLAPTTFMNASGKSVQAMMNFYNIAIEDVLVMHDELAFEPGVVKFKFAGGHNGHNGLRDIHRLYGEKYWRLRFGIGHPGDKSRVTGWVLGKAPEADRKLFADAIEKSVRGIEECFFNKDEQAGKTAFAKFQEKN